MLKKYPEGNVKVFFLLHTSKQNAPAKTAADAAVWDKRLKLANQRNASTLADGERKGLTEYFGDNKKGNVVLKRGFEVHAIDVDNFAKAVQEAVDAG